MPVNLIVRILLVAPCSIGLAKPHWIQDLSRQLINGHHANEHVLVRVVETAQGRISPTGQRLGKVGPTNHRNVQNPMLGSLS